MLRHACGFALAKKGHETRALQALSRPQEHPAHGTLYRVIAEQAQEFLALKIEAAGGGLLKAENQHSQQSYRNRAQCHCEKRKSPVTHTQPPVSQPVRA